MIDYPSFAYILAGFILACAIWALVSAIRKKMLSSFLSRQKRLSQESEAQAVQLLKKKGFGVIATQPVLTYELYINDNPVNVQICADLLVEKNGYTFVAEVKSGDFASDIRTIATRRQLLEYYFAYEADGVLLVDMTRKQISLVQFAIGEEDASE